MDLAVALAYIIAILLLGLVKARRRPSAASFWVADRGAGAVAVAGSLVATAVGGSATVGLASLGARHGLAGAWWLLSGTVGLLLLALLGLAGRVRARQAFTLPEILGASFGQAIRVASALLVLLAWLGVVAAQIVAAGSIASVLWPGRIMEGMVAAAVVFGAYTVLGGQRAVLRTDMVQAPLILAGLAVATGAGLWRVGANALAGSGLLAFPQGHGLAGEALLVLIVTVMATYLAGPDIYSRLLAAGSPQRARRAAWMAGLALIPFALLGALAGVAAALLWPGLAPDEALPSLMLHLLPSGLRGLVVAALAAALMSSADTCLMTVGTLLASDIVRPLRPQTGDNSLVLLSRLAMVVSTGLALGVALLVQGVIPALMLSYTVFTGGLAAPTLLALVQPQRSFSPYSAGAAMALGGGVALAGRFLGPGYLVALAPLLALATLIFFPGGPKKGG